MKTKKYLTEFLYKAFAPFSRNSTVLHGDYLYPLLEAARSHCYVENVHTTSNKADSLHRRIELTYEEDVAAAYSRVLRPLIRKQHIAVATLAIDITDENFYGYYTDQYLHPWTGEDGIQARYQFAALSLVGTHKIPLLALPFSRGMAKEELLQFFLQVAHRLFTHIRCILLDAGFYSGEVMALLQQERYIIRAPQNCAIERYIVQTNGWKAWQHTIKWTADKTTKRITTTVVIVRHVLYKSKYIDCSYATNMKLETGMDYMRLYSKRWQIETNFRMQDQVHIKSKSVCSIVRYFYFMISMLLHALWLLFYRTTMAFDRFKIHAANQLFLQQLGLQYAQSVL